MSRLIASLLLLVPAVTLAADKYTEADFTWGDPILKSNKPTIIAAINKFAREIPACATIDIKSVRFDPVHGNPDDLAFEVDCGTSANKVTQNFTVLDMEDEVAKAAPKK